MRKSTICACILFTLIARNTTQQNRHALKTSGILHLSLLKSNYDIGRAMNASWEQWASHIFDYWRVIQKPEYTGSKEALTSLERLLIIVTAGSCVWYELNHLNHIYQTISLLLLVEKAPPSHIQRHRIMSSKVFSSGQSLWFPKSIKVEQPILKCTEMNHIKSITPISGSNRSTSRA